MWLKSSQEFSKTDIEEIKDIGKDVKDLAKDMVGKAKEKLDDIATAELVQQTVTERLPKAAVGPKGKGWEKTIKKIKKDAPEVDNPWALAWWMKDKGYKPGGKK